MSKQERKDYQSKEKYSTFAAISEAWLESQRVELKASSIVKYSNILKLYLTPQYGIRQIENISRSEVISFSRDLLTSGRKNSKGLAPKTVNDIISVLKNIFEYAVREQGYYLADIKDISVRQPQRPMRILSLAEQKKLSDYLYNTPTPCHLGILLCLYTGLRIGEVCALKWEDIYVDEQYIYVHQSMQRIQTNNSSTRKTEIVIMPPKSGCSIRKIPIPNEMLRLLLSFQKQDDAFLLTGTIHRFIEPRTMENHFKTVAQECNIYNINFHALRHTFATRCVEVGFDIHNVFLKLPGTEKCSIPLAVCVSKSDTFLSYIKDPEAQKIADSDMIPLRDERTQDYIPEFNAEEYNKLNQEIRKLTKGPLMAVLRVGFLTYNFFAFSATGCATEVHTDADSGESYQYLTGPATPKRIAEPLFWIFCKLGYIRPHTPILRPVPGEPEKWYEVEIKTGLFRKEKRAFKESDLRRVEHGGNKVLHITEIQPPAEYLESLNYEV